MLLIIVSTVLLNVALYLIAQKELLPVMAHLEVERVQKQLKLGLTDLYEFVDELQRMAVDYAAWNDTYEFVESLSSEYRSSNLVASTFENLQISFCAIINRQGRVVFGGYYDSETGTLGELGAEFLQEFSQEHRLWAFDDEIDSLGGYYQFGKNIYAMASEPIVTSDDEGPIRGAFLFGRLLDQTVKDDFSADWGYGFEVKRLDVGSQSQYSGFEALKSLFDVSVQGSDNILGRIRVLDIFGRPLFELHSIFHRDFSVHGQKILDVLIRWNLVICLMFALFFYLAVDKALRSRELRAETDVKFRKLSQEFETILDGIPNPLSLISPDLKVLWANRSGAKLLSDVAPSEHGKYISQVDYVSGFKDGETAVERSLVSKMNETHAAELKDGRMLEESAYPLIGDDGEVTSIIRLVEDVTEATFLKREADQNSRLASIGELAAGVAHEINNPTGMLLLNLGLLTDVFLDLEPIIDERYAQDPGLELGNIPYGILRTKVPYLLNEMTDGAQRIKRIVEDLKGFARSEIGQPHEPVDVNEVCAAAIRLVDYQLSQATLFFSFSAGEDLPLVKGHFRRLEQVVVNLLVNATQALEDREKKISLTTRVNDDGTWVLIEVQDQGRGIAADVIDKVTDPFFTTRRNEGGTGLGLSLSARIAEEHSGSLRIYSRVGVGSLIRLQLPVPRSGDES